MQAPTVNVVEKNEMVERMVGTYEAARFTMNDSPRIDDRMRAVTEEARIFYKYHIPMWPLGMLIRKIIRRLVMPVMMPQVEFNLAVRDVLLELRQRSDMQTAANRESSAMVLDLEAQVESLQTQVRTLTARLAASAAAAPPSPNGIRAESATVGASRQ